MGIRKVRRVHTSIIGKPLVRQQLNCIFRTSVAFQSCCLPLIAFVRWLQGVTLIVGGSYNGKSTLLQALEKGIYNKVKGKTLAQ